MTVRRKRVALREVLKRELGDATFSMYYHRERAISEIARMVRDARQGACMTQVELAKKAHTSQTVIARLESGADRRVPSLDLLDRVARALKARLLVQFDNK